MRRPPTVLILWQALSLTLLVCAGFFGMFASFGPAALDWGTLICGVGMLVGPPAAALYCIHRGARPAAYGTMLLGMITSGFVAVAMAMGILSMVTAGAYLTSLTDLLLFGVPGALLVRATLLQGEAARRMRCGALTIRPGTRHSTLRIER